MWDGQQWNPAGRWAGRDVAIGAQLHRLDGAADRAVAGYDGDPGARPFALDPFEQLHAGLLRQAEIGRHQVRGVGSQQGERGLGAFRPPSR